MTDIEVVLTDLGEITTRDIASNENPNGLKENIMIARRGGSVSKKAREFYEKEIGKKSITSVNALGNKYSGNSMLDYKK